MISTVCSLTVIESKCHLLDQFEVYEICYSSIFRTKMKSASILATSALIATVSAVSPGGWYHSVVSDSSTKTLLQALTKQPADYAPDVELRICVHKVLSLEQQVVAGMNYRFHLLGAPVGADANSTLTGWCDRSSIPKIGLYEVDLFEQAWTNTLRVTGISAQ